MKKFLKPLKFPSKLSILFLLTTSMLFQACGGSKKSSSSTPSSADARKVESPKEVTSAEPTMGNMQTALVDAIKVISTDTVAEITTLAKEQKTIPIPNSQFLIPDS